MRRLRIEYMPVEGDGGREDLAEPEAVEVRDLCQHAEILGQDWRRLSRDGCECHGDGDQQHGSSLGTHGASYSGFNVSAEDGDR